MCVCVHVSVWYVCMCVGVCNVCVHSVNVCEAGCMSYFYFLVWW